MSKEITLAETGALLLAAQKIVLCTHVSPDGDTLGSALGLALALKKMGREVLVYCDDLVHKSLAWLPGSELLQRPETGVKVQADLLAVIDASSFDRIGAVADAVAYKHLLNIDHHISNDRFAEYLYLDAQAAATGEIMCDLLAAMAWEMDKDIATCFYAAISTDCGSFRYSNTTPKTMQTAAALLSRGVEPAAVNDALEVHERAVVNLLAKVLPSMTFACGDKIAYLTVTHDLYDKNINTDSFVSYPRNIEGVEIAVMFKAVEREVVRVSMRSHKADVAAVAVHFGGGGHLHAAGCTIYAPVEEAQRRLLAELGKLV